MMFAFTDVSFVVRPVRESDFCIFPHLILRTCFVFTSHLQLVIFHSYVMRDA